MFPRSSVPCHGARGFNFSHLKHGCSIPLPKVVLNGAALLDASTAGTVAVVDHQSTGVANEMQCE